MEKLLLNETDVVSQYNKLKNIHKVAKYFNVSISPITRILKSNGFDLTNRRYNVNHNYFDIIDTEEKAYWLGFLYADGYIRERKSGSSLEMKLSIKDKHHLELFRESMGSNHKIVDGFNRVKYKGGVSSSHMSSLAMYSSRLVESIKSQGFHSRKTFTIEQPNINDELIHHFIRGFFDGDGYMNKDFIGKIEVHSNWLQFLNTLCKLVELDYEGKINTRGYARILIKKSFIKVLKQFIDENNLTHNTRKWNL